MPDYSKGKIYKICSNNPEIKEVYYGSTVQTLSNRMTKHRAGYKSWINGKGGACSIFYFFKQYDLEQFHIELVLNYPCENKEELLKKENEYIRGYECVNKYVAYQSVQERKEHDKQYKEVNKERIKQYIEANKEKITEYKKQYYEANKEKKAEYDKRYREANKERIAAYREANKERYKANKIKSS